MIFGVVFDVLIFAAWVPPRVIIEKANPGVSALILIPAEPFADADTFAKVSFWIKVINPFLISVAVLDPEALKT